MKHLDTKRKLAVVGALGLLGLSLLACLFLVTAPLWGPAVGYQNVMHTCMGYTTQGRFQMGVNWILPWMSSMPPVVFDVQLCAALPYAPGWPPKGAVVLPP